jgi:CRISPR/Cas system endoribonuclease Cas6 (RAMP superfamily)
MTLRLHGPDTLARYVRFLLRFGEYSGVGIKTAIGMGGIRIKEGRTKDD